MQNMNSKPLNLFFAGLLCFFSLQSSAYECGRTPISKMFAESEYVVLVKNLKAPIYMTEAFPSKKSDNKSIFGNDKMAYRNYLDNFGYSRFLVLHNYKNDIDEDEINIREQPFLNLGFMPGNEYVIFLNDWKDFYHMNICFYVNVTEKTVHTDTVVNKEITNYKNVMSLISNVAHKEKKINKN